MPLCKLYLLSLYPTTADPLSRFLSALRSSALSPLVVSRVIRWIILPSTISTEALLAQNIHWDILLILPNTDTVPADLAQQIQHQFTVTVGIPSRLLQDFHAKNQTLLHPAETTIPKLSGALENPKLAPSPQSLELSPDLQSWIRSFTSSHTPESRGPVSMLNLLSFNPDMKSSYLHYGRAFADSIGSKRGGDAKLVGTVVDVDGTKKEDGDGGWDEFALAHYPSILHFADMLASEDYQRVNAEFRVPSLRDTLILFTSEVGMGGGGTGEMVSKL